MWLPFKIKTLPLLQSTTTKNRHLSTTTNLKPKQPQKNYPYLHSQNIQPPMLLRTEPNLTIHQATTTHNRNHFDLTLLSLSRIVKTVKLYLPLPLPDQNHQKTALVVDHRPTQSNTQPTSTTPPTKRRPYALPLHTTAPPICHQEAVANTQSPTADATVDSLHGSFLPCKRRHPRDSPNKIWSLGLD